MDEDGRKNLKSPILLPLVTAVESGLGDRKRNLDAGAAAPRVVHHHATVVHHHDLLNDRQAESGPLRARGEKRLKDSLARRLGNARTVVFHRYPATLVGRIHPSLNADAWGDTRALAGIDRVAYEIAENLPQE